MPFHIVRQDITKMRVDAIVNSANPRPVVGGGVDRAIHLAAGGELLAARRNIGVIQTGEAFLTPGFRLPARFVIHTVGPVYQDGGKGEASLLARCYESSLALAVEHGLASVAFPLISAGIFGYPRAAALEIATKTICAFLAQHELEVFLVVFDDASYRISSERYQQVASYIDAHYAGRAAHEDRRYDEGKREREIALSYQRRGAAAKDIRCEPVPDEGAGASLEELLARTEQSFSERLLALIDASGEKDPAIYHRANVDRKLFSKIKSHQNYRPKKSTALAFAIALGLSLDETQDLIRRAGYTLSRSSKADIIIAYFLERGEHDIFTINETLFAFHQPTLG